MEQDPLNFARDIIIERLSRDVLDDDRRWNLAVAIVTHLDMCKLIKGGVGGQ